MHIILIWREIEHSQDVLQEHIAENEGTKATILNARDARSITVGEKEIVGVGQQVLR